MKHTAIVNGERVDVQLVRVGDTTMDATVGTERYVLEVETVEEGVYWVRWGNRSIEISVTPNRESYSVAMAGHSSEVEIVDARSALRKAAQQADNGRIELRAPMPGKVVKVLVSEGATVAANQGLVVIEAMKMQNEIKSPKSGTVLKLGVKEAGAVNAGDLLAIVE